jgi:radical SAM protein with 4Fe4S-binding SPASM domain
MPPETWQAILDGLRETRFEGTVVWSRYAEALAQKDIINRIRAVRSAAPRARLAMNSNGDYLTAALLDELADAGMQRMWVDIYLPDEQPYSTELARHYLDKFLARVKHTASMTADSPELTGTLDYDRIDVLLVCRNLDSMRKHELSDRGGLVTIAAPVQRTSPCYAPYKHLVIDWDGSIVPCCQLRSDASQHASYVTGRIGKNFDLLDAYLSLAGWRDSLRHFGPKQAPCNTCNVWQYNDDPLSVAISRALSGDSKVSSALRSTVAPLLAKRTRF